jgi:hypothetical protein
MARIMRNVISANEVSHPFKVTMVVVKQKQWQDRKISIIPVGMQ